MSSLQAAIADLTKRLERLERAPDRTRRGWANQREAAEYVGRSREYLRQRARDGTGPPCSDGKYHYDDLDRWMETDS
jgi:hypothetical protein